MQGVPHLPAAWYVLGPSHKIGHRPKEFRLKNKRFVVYRNDHGKVSLHSLHCPHMGVNLATAGTFKEGKLTCRLHGWQFDNKGTCTRVPADPENLIPDFANLHNFPVKERHGVAYFYNGQEPAYDLPFFKDEDEKDFIGHTGVETFQKAIWYGPAVNAFDVAHFIYSHQRVLEKPSELDLNDKHVAKATHYYRIESSYWLDRIVSFIYGKNITLEIEIWGGNVIVARSNVGTLKSYMISYCTPTEGVNGRTDIIVYKKKRSGFAGFFDRLILPLQAQICRKVFQDESDEIKDAIIRQNTLHPNTDKDVLKYLSWFSKAYS